MAGVLVVAVLCGTAANAGCAPAQPARSCDRSAHWIGASRFEEDAVRPSYLAALEEAFPIDPVTGDPLRGNVAWERLNQLERWCWQMRAEP